MKRIKKFKTTVFEKEFVGLTVFDHIGIFFPLATSKTPSNGTQSKLKNYNFSHMRRRKCAKFEVVYKVNHQLMLYSCQALNFRTRAKQEILYFSCGCLATEVGVSQFFLTHHNKWLTKLWWIGSRSLKQQYYNKGSLGVISIIIYIHSHPLATSNVLRNRSIIQSKIVIFINLRRFCFAKFAGIFTINYP